MPKTEHEKQLSGDLYNAFDKEITNLQATSRVFLNKFNAEIDKTKRYDIMKKWFKNIGDGSYIEPNFFCDFGCHLVVGNNVYMNTNCTILDSAMVTIGDYTLIGSGVQFCTPMHPIDPISRRSGVEYANPITIGKDCWIGSGAIILHGVTIGDGTTIGAGSIVTKDIPANSIAVGNPCKVIKTLN
ncbi:MAG: sugar O-acetyltransferase [Candidatus Gastranaerophilales bacterium]|nr:sugar O-acetyltransferase [Candidatus Gastranaerophilales bacterium]